MPSVLTDIASVSRGWRDAVDGPAPAVDQLTRLPHRSGFIAQLRAALGQGLGRIGVCHIGLDLFEEVNDRLGAAVGDRLLVEVAHRLYTLCASPGHLVARLNGDKFAVLLLNPARPQDVGEFAERAIDVLASQPFDIDGTDICITASAGIVQGPVYGWPVQDVIRAADTALHCAKADGRARVRTYEPTQAPGNQERLALARSLPAAVNNGEFTLHYQRLVDLPSRRMIGHEALARWEHPVLGRLAPGQFLDIAEDAGMIVHLGETLLRQACRQAAMWPRDVLGAAAFVSVNLAPAQLSHPTLFASVMEAVRDAGLDPSALQLEITEHAILDTSDRTCGVLRDLARCGIKVVLDDFGTGYSNLAVLRRLPLHGIKLDASFVRDAVETGGSTHPVLGAVVRIAEALNLVVTAEGIETEAQATLMEGIGCHVGQGWHFGHPIAADMLARSTPDVTSRGALARLARGGRRVVPRHAWSGRHVDLRQAV
jgi:diguanylate cyclase (GGDEF)-like protein